LVRALELLKSEFAPETVQAFWRTHIDGNPAEMVAQELGWHDPSAPHKGANRVRKARSRVQLRLKKEFAGLNEFPPVE
jgi:RNA polymerase sigma-70 factor (ECF subfamily)